MPLASDDAFEQAHQQTLAAIAQRKGMASPQQEFIESTGALDELQPTAAKPTGNNLQRGILRSLRMAGRSDVTVPELPANDYGGGTVPVPPTVPPTGKAELSDIRALLRPERETTPPTQTIERMGPGGKVHIFGFNAQTGRYDRDEGEAPPKGSTARGAFITQQALRKEFVSHPLVKELFEVDGKYRNMEQAIAEARGNPQSMIAVDQALITMYNKMLDPMSVVRESEYARSQADIALLNRIRGKLDKIVTGGAGLTAAERKALVDMARRFYSVSRSRYDETSEFFQQNAIDAGVDPARVIQPIAPHEAAASQNGRAPAAGDVSDPLGFGRETTADPLGLRPVQEGNVDPLGIR